MAKQVLTIYLEIFGLLVCYSYGYGKICPKQPHWMIRAKAVCNGSSTSNYQCLYDRHKNVFVESCTWKPDFVRPGHKYVLLGGRDDEKCDLEYFQPFVFWSNVSSSCVLKKMLCSSLGQISVDNGSILADRFCRCDYQNGYAYITPPRNLVTCMPSVEDCSCYHKECPGNGILQSDYECKSRYLEASKITKLNTVLSTTMPTLIGDAAIVYRNVKETVTVLVNVLVAVAVFFVAMRTCTGHWKIDYCSLLRDSVDLRQKVKRSMKEYKQFWLTELEPVLVSKALAEKNVRVYLDVECSDRSKMVEELIDDYSKRQTKDFDILLSVLKEIGMTYFLEQLNLL